MGFIGKHISQYAASRRGSFVSQTTTCEIGGKLANREISEAKIPVFPPLSFTSLFAYSRANTENVLDHGYSQIPVIAARYAIAHALQHMNISKGDEILLPAYHCTVMVAPIVKMGGKPVFYKIKPNLDTDLGDVEQKITPRTKAIIAVNYCGFIQNMANVDVLCRDKNIKLIEDCAHSFFGHKNGVTVGGYGDYILVSSRKFFPVNEGGVLLIRQPDKVLPVQKTPGLIKSLKSNLALIERSLRYGKLWLLAPLVEVFDFFKNSLKYLLTRKPNDPHDFHDPDPLLSVEDTALEGENSYDHACRDKKADFIERLLPNLLNFTTIAKRRREYFHWLNQQFSTIDHCRPLIKELPEGIIPFMFPVYIENLDKYFPAFEDAALPMQRFAQFLWSDVTEETCAVTADYSKNVILFPCHQELSLQDIKWLEKTVRTILEQVSQ